MEAASPERGAAPDAAPTPEESIIKGMVPASAAAIAARSAAGPLPTITTSHDSMVTRSVPLVIAP